MPLFHYEAHAPGRGVASDPDLVGLRRWLATDGKVGYCPDFYPDFVAADRCHCPPWELAKQSIYWRDKALVVVSAENYAREEKRKHNQ